jgi:hypothetical protein
MRARRRLGRGDETVVEVAAHRLLLLEGRASCSTSAGAVPFERAGARDA